MKNEIKLGDDVVKVATDYTNGRTGKVEEIKDLTPMESNPLFKKFRYRVRWTKESNGGAMSSGYKILKNGLRTWCQRSAIDLI